MADQPPGAALVLRPNDPTARKGALLFAVLAVIGVVGLIIEIVTTNIIGAVAAAIVALAGVLLTLVVVVGRSTMRVTVDGDALHIAGRQLARSDIVVLKRRPVREGGLDVVGREEAVLYSMPAWFDAAQEQQLAGALGVEIVEPPPPEPEPENEAEASAAD